MPKAILALRSYPMAILMAMVLFACSLVIATASVGKLSNGGDDEGSGMGGTGKSASFGDSGFGGTGGPSPFFGGADTTADDSTVEPDTDQWPTPWLPREQETAGVPAEMQPLIELQRNLPQDPFRQNNNNQLSNPALHILDPVKTPLPPHTQRMLEMANSAESERVQPVLEIKIRIPESLPEPDLTDMSRQQFELAEQLSAPAPGPGSEPGSEPESAVTPSLTGELAEELSEIAELAGMPAAQEEIPVIDAMEERRNSPERIQRPELPPFQRMRPAVDRSSVGPPRVQPMRI